MGKLLFCIVGPSGSGKSTNVAYAKKKTGFREIISTTTREPRKGEIDGIDYHFVSREIFDNIDFLEKDEYAGNIYGTSLKDVLEAYIEQKNYAFAIVTLEGAKKLDAAFQEKNIDIQVITIFISVPIEKLEKRMIKRGDKPEKIKERIENISTRDEYSDANKSDYIFHSNDNLSITDNCIQFTELILNIVNKHKNKSLNNSNKT